MKQTKRFFLRRIPVLLALTLVLTALLFPVCAAEYVTDEGLTYKVVTSKSGDYVKITGYSGTGGQLTVPDSIDGLPVKELSSGIFKNSTSLTSVVLPDGLTWIGDRTFSGCTGLISVHLPANLTTIGNWAFDGCTSLARIDLPAGLTHIGINAFFGCTSLSSIDLPDGLDSILDGVFSGCTGLTAVNLPDGLTQLGTGAFSGCTGLTTIDLPDSLTRLGTGVFSGCTSLSEVRLPANLAYLSPGTFSNCTSLTAIDLPDSLTSIGGSAFSRCTELTSLDLPAGLTAIGDYAFAFSTGLAQMEIPDSVTYMGEGVFRCCEGLTAVNLPEGLTSIPFWAFDGCIGLTSIDLPKGLETIEKCAFSGCSGLTQIDFPDTLTTIERYAFSGCTGLTEVTLPDSITTLDEGVFARCTALTQIKLPDSLTEMGPYLLEECTSLASVDLPKNLSAIADHTFSECASLTELTIPGSVTSIGVWAFHDCVSLKDIYFENTADAWAKVSIDESNYCLRRAAIHCWCTPTQKDHIWNEGEVTQPPTEEAEGILCFTCITCGATRTEPIDKLEHIHRYDTVIIEPTCTENGCTIHTCSCGDQFTSNEVPALGHEYLGGVCARCYEPDPNYIPENPFTDVEETDYYYVPVLWAVENGITSGTGGGKFSPHQTCTRAQVVTFLWRTFGQPDPQQPSNPFADVNPNDYFYKAVLWAVEQGITSGTGNGKFSPNNPCTRDQVVTFLWRALGKPAPETDSNPFIDVTEGVYYYEPVLWAVENGITSGTSTSTFSPGNPCTRAQVVTFLYRAFPEA